MTPEPKPTQRRQFTEEFKREAVRLVEERAEFGEPPAIPLAVEPHAERRQHRVLDRHGQGVVDALDGRVHRPLVPSVASA